MNRTRTGERPVTVYVEALSLVNALGDDDDAILANLAQGRAPGMEGPLVRTVDGFEAPFGRVTIDLAETPSDSLGYFIKANNPRERLDFNASNENDSRLRRVF